MARLTHPIITVQQLRILAALRDMGPEPVPAKLPGLSIGLGYSACYNTLGLVASRGYAAITQGKGAVITEKGRALLKEVAGWLAEAGNGGAARDGGAPGAPGEGGAG